MEVEAGLRSLPGVPGPGPRSHLDGAQGEELKVEGEEQEQEGEEGLQGQGGRLATGPSLQLEAGEARGELSSRAPCPGPTWR